MSNVSGWIKVASGFRLVVSAATNHVSSQGGNAAVQATKHGYELARNMRIASVAVAQDDDRSNYEPSSSSTSTNAGTAVNSVNVLQSKISSEHKENLNEKNPSISTKNNADFVSKNDSSPIESEHLNSPMKRLEEGSAIPSTRISRAFNFASLGMKLTMGTAVEATSRLLNPNSEKSSSIIANNKNADILASSLCRMRGAALKIGQMLSIQDESVLPPAMTRALEQVRAGADAMPRYQLEQQLESQLGAGWESKFFEHFDWVPIAAASIGQVHKAVLKDSGRDVAVKVQYPGVANSIESDLNNMSMLISMFGFVPKGLFMENIIKVGREELKLECNYLLEKENQERFRKLLNTDDSLKRAKFVVPKVIPELCTEQILTTEFAPGGNIDKVSNLSQNERNRIGRAIMRLTMLELFSWRFMQTDPNWGNFLHDIGTGTTYCIDFGAARGYNDEFVALYCEMICAAANKDEEELMQISKKLGFLTGDENETMLNAHRDSGFTIGEPFQSHDTYDFGNSQITKRIAEKSAPFLHHRLT